MEDRCIFCGIEVGRFRKKKLFCGNTEQTICNNCYAEYKSLSAIERAKAALRTGRAENAASLQAYLEDVHNAIQEKKAEENHIQKTVTDLKCLRCDGQMLNYGQKTFKLGEESYFFSDLNRLITGSVSMNVFRCEKCGKIEFFAFDDNEFSDQLR